MTICNGVPAEQYALAYVEGTLPAFEAERFEEHYFDCAVCLSHLQAIQAVGRELERHPVSLPESFVTGNQQPRQKNLAAWPVVRRWAWGAIAALLVLGVYVYHLNQSRPAQPVVAQGSSPASPQIPPPATTQPGSASSSASSIQPSQLADLVLPAFTAPHLRGESGDEHFQAGMAAYSKGDCKGALSALAQVPATADEARPAQFYTGACQMRSGEFSAAGTNLKAVADAGDSPQQESALYYLAQISLAQNDPAAAHRLLLETIALHGDLERRARDQDRKVTALIDAGHAAESGQAPVR
jgi:TolA-binding protein